MAASVSQEGPAECGFGEDDTLYLGLKGNLAW